jgi:hypothetical protein
MYRNITSYTRPLTMPISRRRPTNHLASWTDKRPTGGQRLYKYPYLDISGISHLLGSWATCRRHAIMPSSIMPKRQWGSQHRDGRWQVIIHEGHTHEGHTASVEVPMDWKVPKGQAARRKILRRASKLGRDSFPSITPRSLAVPRYLYTTKTYILNRSRRTLNPLSGLEDKIRRYEDTKIRRYEDTKIRRYEDTKILEID